jgi:hypothetical protein
MFVFVNDLQVVKSEINESLNHLLDIKIKADRQIFELETRICEREFLIAELQHVFSNKKIRKEFFKKHFEDEAALNTNLKECRIIFIA